MYVSVARGGCIGCAACTELAPTLFHMRGDGTPDTGDGKVPPELEAAVRKAAVLCPVNVIYIDEEL